MTMEQRLDQLEKRNKRLTVGLTMMAMVALLSSYPLVEMILQVLQQIVMYLTWVRWPVEISQGAT